MDGMADYIRAPSRMFPEVSDFEAATGFLNSEKMRSLGLHHPHSQHPFGGSIHPGHPHSPRLPPMPLATIQQHLFAIQQRTNAYPLLPTPPAAGGTGAGAGGLANNNNNNTNNNNNNNNNNPLLPIPFPHHLLSQWTLAAAAGFGLNQLGLFGLAGLPAAGLAGLQQAGHNPMASISPTQSTRQQQSPPATITPPSSAASVTSPVAHLLSQTADKAEVTASRGHNSPPANRHHRFSPYPAISVGGNNKLVTSGVGLNHIDDQPQRSPTSIGSKLSFDK